MRASYLKWWAFPADPVGFGTRKACGLGGALPEEGYGRCSKNPFRF